MANAHSRSSCVPAGWENCSWPVFDSWNRSALMGGGAFGEASPPPKNWKGMLLMRILLPNRESLSA